MGLMQQIRDYRVPKGAVALWWLGQNGFIFKTPEGTTAGVDLYLTDSCATLPEAVHLDLKRRVPVFIEPEELQVDLFACTHNHMDHADPETIRRLRNKDTARFLGPMPACATFRAEGVESGRIEAAWPQFETEFRDIHIRGAFAMPTDSSDLNHMGFILRFGGGPKIYITDDTDYTELLHDTARYQPDMMITCINGGFNNLSHWEAALVAKHVRPKVAVPCHYDMFGDNSVDPKQFAAALHLQAPDVCYTAMKHAEPFVFSAAG